MKGLQRFLLIALWSFVRLASAQTDSLDIKIGQMIIVGLPNPSIDNAILRQVNEGLVGGLILFEKNIPPKNSYVNLKKITWTYQHAAPLPLFIAIDQEGGRVNRLKEKYGFPPSESAAFLGRSQSLDSVHFYAGITAGTLAALGFNVNFTPVVDLAVNPDNPVIAKAERSYSADPIRVTAFATAVVQEHRKVGVITVLKHFPGHGSSTGDTHLGMTDVSNTWTPQELIPYKELIASGYVDAIMTAHIVNRNLDSTALPGTLSDKMINGMLRDQLGFKGVVFSDDMQMQAITKYYGLRDAIRMSILAGVDVLMFSNNISGNQERTVDTVHAIIRSFVADGTIPLTRIDASFRRIITLKKGAAGEAGAEDLHAADWKEMVRKAEDKADSLQAQNEQLKRDLVRQREENKSKKKRR